MYVESIRIQNGRVRHIRYHQARFDKTRWDVYGIAPKIKLRTLITAIPDTPLVKCRIIYDQQILGVEYHMYTMEIISSLRLVEVDGDLSYDHKSLERTAITTAYGSRGDCDDVIMVRSGLLTDTHYGNIALYDGRGWFTPHRPMLIGTMRAYLLDNRKITARRITVDDLSSYSLVSVFNAMIPLGRIVIPTSKIY